MVICGDFMLMPNACSCTTKLMEKMLILIQQINVSSFTYVVLDAFGTGHKIYPLERRLL